MKAGTFGKYIGLEMSGEARILLITNPKKFASFCNGVGSEVGGWFRRLIYRITPDTIWGLNITPCSDIHDVEYWIFDTFANETEALAKKKEVDDRFACNLLRFIDRETEWDWLRKLRRRRVWKYRLLLRECGKDSFLDGVTFTDQV